MKPFILILFLAFVLNLNAQINQGLIFHFPIENNIEETANDYRFDLVGDSSLSSNRFGGAQCAWDLSNSQNYIKASLGQDAFGLDSFHSFSIAFWMQLDSQDIMYQGDFQGLVRLKDNADTYFGLALYDLQTPLYSDDYLGRNYGLWDQPWNRSADLGIDTERWHHIALVYKQGSIQYYRDGLILATDTLPSNNYLRFADTIYIGGASEFNGFGASFYGKLDDIRIYSRSLDSTEVIEIRDLQSNCTPSSTQNKLAPDLPIFTYQQPSRIEVQKEGNYLLELYTLHGQLVYSRHLYGFQKQNLSIQALSTGVYLAKVSNEHQSRVVKIFIE